MSRWAACSTLPAASAILYGCLADVYSAKVAWSAQP